MKTLIAGAGRLGVQIAQVLAAASNDVTLVDDNEQRVEELKGNTPVRLLLGDPCEPGFLEHAGAPTADLVIATTDNDEDNLVISLLAKRQFAVARVAARVNEPENAWLFDHRWGVDIAVPSEEPLVSLIEEATGAADTVALLRLSKAGVDVVETAITSHSRAAGCLLSDISLPEGTVIATIVRNGRATTPTPGLRLNPGDELLLVSHQAAEDEIRAAFQ